MRILDFATKDPAEDVKMTILKSISQLVAGAWKEGSSLDLGVW